MDELVEQYRQYRLWLKKGGEDTIWDLIGTRIPFWLYKKMYVDGLTLWSEGCEELDEKYRKKYDDSRLLNELHQMEREKYEEQDKRDYYLSKESIKHEFNQFVDEINLTRDQFNGLFTPLMENIKTERNRNHGV